MPWIKIDDHFDEHPKHAAIGPVGWGVWLAGLAYCNRTLTDGFIPYAVAERIGGSWKVRVPVEPEVPDGNGVREVEHREQVWTIDIGSGMHGETITTEWVIELLVINGLWEEVPGGYRIHDYGEYQPSRAVVLEERRKANERQAAYRESRGKSQRDSGRSNGRTSDPPVPVPVPSPVPGSVSPEPAPIARMSIEPEDGLPNITPEVQEAAEACVGTSLFRASDKVQTDLDGLVERQGPEAVIKAFPRITKGKRIAWPQLVYGTRNLLEPIGRVTPKEVAAAEEAESEARAHQKRLQRTANEVAWFEAQAKGNSDAA